MLYDDQNVGDDAFPLALSCDGSSGDKSETVNDDQNVFSDITKFDKIEIVRLV